MLARAHDPGLSVVNARLRPGGLVVQLTIARSDLELLARLDRDHDGKISHAELEASRPALQLIGREAFRVSSRDQRVTPDNVSVELDAQDGVQFQIRFSGLATGPCTLRAALLEKMPWGHRQFFCMGEPGSAARVERMLDARQAELTIELDAAPQPHPTPKAWLEFLKLGVWHIVSGYDHLLFLLGLLVVGSEWRQAFKIITSFTVAHSFTLALATFNLVPIAPRIIEPLIAASIVFVAAQNLLNGGGDKRWLLTFGFGLVHGCGFASALRDLGLGSQGESVIWPLASFNLGVELGQLAVAALALPLLRGCQKSPGWSQRWSPATSVAILFAGSYLLVERTYFCVSP